MNIVKITGKPENGKSQTLATLAGLDGLEVQEAKTIMQSMPLLESKVLALGPRTYVDNATPSQVVRLEMLAESYPDTYWLFVAGKDL